MPSAAGSGSRPMSARSRGPPTATARPSTVARAPRPASDSKPLAADGLIPRALAPATTARASGCSESASTEAASRSSSGSSAADTATSAGCPLVSVPVLSKMMTCSSLARSSAMRSLTSRPLRAPSEVEMAITSGIARPRAWGQAMTSTVAVRTSAPSRSPSSHQNANVTIPDPSAT